MPLLLQRSEEQRRKKRGERGTSDGRTYGATDGAEVGARRGGLAANRRECTFCPFIHHFLEMQKRDIFT